MDRFYGIVGYANSVETPADSGIWKDVITELPYYGDVLRNTRQLDDGEKLNNDISVSNSISIVADDKAYEDFMKIRYVQWRERLWTISNIEVRSPRLILRLGKLYNGPTP